MLALVEEGDEVIIPSPYWVSFPDQVQFAGGTPGLRARPTRGTTSVPTFADIEARGHRAHARRDHQLAVQSDRRGDRARRSCASIVEWCASRDCFLMFDETYEFFVYDGAEHVSAMRWFERVSGDGHRA